MVEWVKNVENIDDFYFAFSYVIFLEKRKNSCELN